uniref:Uncharacterized protein n=1 Tax=Panagrolaimus sp. PS1159 TaxID=55785 RepID=A0AC35F6V3_9BILA
MSGLKGEANTKGPIYTISSSSSICTKLDDIADVSQCNALPSGSNPSECNPLPGTVVIDMNLIESPETVLNCKINKSTKNHVKFNLEESYSEKVYSKEYCNYPEKIYYRENSCKENLKALCQTCSDFVKKAGKWCCLIFVILGLILFFCLRIDFHR